MTYTQEEAQAAAHELVELTYKSKEMNSKIESELIKLSGLMKKVEEKTGRRGLFGFGN